MSTTRPAASPAPADPPAAGFWRWIQDIPGRFQLLTAAAAAAAALLPQRAIPEPLHALRTFGVAVVVIAFVLTWALRGWLRRHVRLVAASTAGMLLALILLHQLFVKPVRYRTVEGNTSTVETVWFVTGWGSADPELAPLTAEDRIRTAGDGWDELRAVWGGSFVLVALAYAVLYLLVINGIVLSLGAADFAQPRRRT